MINELISKYESIAKTLKKRELFLQVIVDTLCELKTLKLIDNDQLVELLEAAKKMPLQD